MMDGWPWWVAPTLALGLGVMTLAPLGHQVLQRGVVFMDLAVAQGAAAAALWLGTWIDHPGPGLVQLAALTGAWLSATVVALVVRRWPDQREALIGLLYVLGACLALLGTWFDPHGRDRMAQLLAADLLWVEPKQLWPLLVAAVVTQCLQRQLGACRWAADAWFFTAFAGAAAVTVPVLGLWVVFTALMVPALWLQRGTSQLTATAIAGGGACAGLLLSALLDGPSGTLVALCMALTGLAALLGRPPTVTPSGRAASG